jgi:hypothetical protein
MSTLKPCPVWARSMVANFRAMFIQKHGKPSTLSDDDIFDICETVHDDNDPPNADVMRVEEMLAREQA